MSGLHFSEKDFAAMMDHDGTGPTIKNEWGGQADVAPTAKQYAALQRKAQQEALRLDFKQLWRLLAGPDLDEEVRFHPQRRWRFDFCHTPTKTAVELEGGVWTGGRHTRGGGYQRDAEKYNAAQALGYTVFRLTTGQIDPEHVEPIIEHIKRAREKRQ